MKKLKVLFFCLLPFVLLGCGADEFTVTSQFSNARDVEKGMPVYYADQEIGRVTNVTENDDGASVVLALDPEQAQKISANAALVVNSIKQGSPLEIYSRETVDFEALIPGQQIQGLNSVVELGAWVVGDAVHAGAKTLSQYVDTFQEYLNSAGFQQDKVMVQEKIKGVTQETQLAIESVNDEVNAAFDGFRNSETTAVQSLEKLGDELSPVVAELAKSGNQIIAQIEALTKNLEESNAQEQGAGVDFLTALLSTLEQLNSAAETELETEMELEAEMKAAEK